MHDSHYRDDWPWYSRYHKYSDDMCFHVMFWCCQCTFVETSVHGARVRGRWWLWHTAEEHRRTTVVWSRKVSLYSQLDSSWPLLASELVYFVFIFCFFFKIEILSVVLWDYLLGITEEYLPRKNSTVEIPKGVFGFGKSISVVGKPLASQWRCSSCVHASLLWLVLVIIVQWVRSTSAKTKGLD